jgi:hypothetical protein
MRQYRKVNPAHLLFLVMMISAGALAEEPVSKSFFGGVAIDGHDTVAYHGQQNRQHEAMEGEEEFTVEWKGAKWRFATRADSEAFAADPGKYAPAYNGFCANALSLGNGLKKTDGTHWQIFDDQLYVFYAREGRERWLSGDYQAFKAAADKAWLEILAEED